MDKKYQVFVSSTFEDLKEERAEVMHALRLLECIPAGMELFPAADEEQWEVIQKAIDECDYYVVIVAGRYGTIAADGISYTEKEYRYALQKAKPVHGFLRRSLDDIPAKHTDTDAVKREKLIRFRELVALKMCRHYDSPKELRAEVMHSVLHTIRTKPAVGWVRADQLASGEATAEILKLRTLVENLKSDLDAARTEAPPGTADLAQGTDLIEVPYTYKEDLWDGGKQYSDVFPTTWDELFAAVALIMMREASDSSLRERLDELVRAHELSKGPLNQLQRRVVQSEARFDKARRVRTRGRLPLRTRRVPSKTREFHRLQETGFA